MASEDFSINIGLHIDDKEVRSKIKDLEKNAIAPLQERLSKVQRGTHEKLVQDFVKVSHEYHRLMGGAITPAQAVRYAAGGTPTSGTTKRSITESATHLLQKRIKEEQKQRQNASKRAEDEARVREGLRKLETREKSPLERVQDTVRLGTQKSLELENISKQQLAAQTERDMQKLYMHLGAMEGTATPFDRVLSKAQDKIRYETFENAEKQITDARNEEERRLALAERQAQILEIIAKNTGIFKKWNQIDKALVQREQRSILRSLQPGEDLTEYQSKVMGVNFGGANIRKTAAIATTVVAALAESVKSVWQEATREKGMLSKISSMTGYSAQADRALQYAGVQNAYQSMASLSSFNDRLRLGQISAEQMQGFAMFGRHTFAQLRRDQNDIRALHAAFAADMANAEARGWTRQTAAQAMGMSDLLPTLGFTPEEMEEFFRLAESAKYEQARAKSAYMTDLTGKTAIDSIKDLMSKNKTGALVGTGVGSAVGLAAGAKLGGLAGTKIGASVGTMFGGAGAVPGAAIGGLIGAGAGLLAGAFGAGKVGGVIGAGVQELSSPDSAGVRMNNTVNVHIDRDAMNEILNSGSSTQTFATTATAEPW